ncbi:hypothetical protein CEQ90_02570 [Lewinellaceae bacterium SD302]|nr:hypothetical protein CEQ90_02570 [Lewinellaceae bacterium SD302]
MKFKTFYYLLVILFLCSTAIDGQSLELTLGVLPDQSTVCGPLNTFEVQVENTDPVQTANNVLVELAAPNGVNVLSVSGTGTLQPNNYVMVGDIGPGEVAVFEATYQLSCDASVITFEFTGNASSDNITGDTLVGTTSERIFADLSLPFQTDPQTIDAFFGKIQTVEVGIVNNGFGSLEVMNYCVSNNLVAVELRGLVVDGVDVGTTPDFVVGTQQCFTVMLNDPFVQQETILAEETWEVVECVDDPMDVLRRAQYGCQGDNDCQDKPQGDYVPTSVSFIGSFPELSIATISSERPACYADEPTLATVRLTNVGTAPAISPGFRILTDNTSGMVIDGSSIIITDDESGDEITDFDIVNTTTGSTCQGMGITLIDYRLTDFRMEVDQSFTVSYAVTATCDCNDCDVRNKYYNRTTILDYFDLCGNLNVDRDATTPSDRYNAFINGLAEGPPSVNDGDQSLVSYFVSEMELDWMTDEFNDAYLEMVVELPCAMDYVPNSVVWVDRNNRIYPVGSVTYTDVNTVGSIDQLIVRFNAADRPSGFQMNAGANFDFMVVADCTEKDLADCSALVFTEIIQTRFDLTSDPSCLASCTTQKVWAPDDLDVRIQCANPGPCGDACDGISFGDFQVFRTNLGLADADNNQVPDGMDTANPAIAQTDRYLRGDSLRAVFSATVQDADNDQNLAFGFIEFPLDHGDFTPLGATITIDRDGTIYTCSAVPLAADGPNQRIVIDFSVAQLKAFGCALPTDFDRYLDGDELLVTMDFTEKNVLPPGTDYLIRDYLPRFYLSETGMSLDGGQCSSLNARMTQVGLTSDESFANANFGACNQPNWRINYGRYIGGSAVDEFTNEIRSIALPDRLVFNKPAEFNYVLSNWRIRLRQLVEPVNTIVDANNIPAQYFVRNEDEVTFLIGDYLKSLENLEIPPDEGYQIEIYPRIQGGCASMVGSYMYDFQFFEEVDENIYCQPEIAREQINRSFEFLGAAVLRVESVEDNVFLCSAYDDARIRVRNVSTIDAINSFFYPEPSGAVIVNRVERANGTEVLPNEFGIYPLGTISRNSFEELTVFFTKNDCENATIDFIAGWDCEGYPQTINDATCTDPSQVALTSANSNADLLVVHPNRNSTAIIDLCDPIPFEGEILSTDLGFIRDIILTITLPPHVYYEAGTFEVAIPGGPGSTFVNYAIDPTEIGGSTYRIDLSVLDEVLNTIGLVGSKDPPNSSISFRFNAITECGYVSGQRSLFTINTRNSCNEPLAPVVRETGRLRTSDTEQDISLSVEAVDLVFNACSPETETLEITADLDGAVVSSADSIRVLLPSGITYVPDSYVPVQNAEPGNNPTVIRDQDGRQALIFPLDRPNNGEEVIRFNLDVIADDVGQNCQSYPIAVDAFAAAEYTCNGMTCESYASRGETIQMVEIRKPDLAFTDLSGDITLDPINGTATAQFTATVVNNGYPLMSGNNVTVAIYEDANGNGTFDPEADVFLFNIEETLGADLGTGESVTISGSETFMTANVCTVIAVLDPELTCTCNTRPSVTYRPEIVYEFPRDYEVCSGDQIMVGPDKIDGYNYGWVSVDGSDLGNLNPTDDSPTVFTAPVNNTGAPITLQYDLRVSTAPCFNDGRINVTIAPALNEMVNVQACAGGTYTLPTTTAEGASNFSWMPAAGLTITNNGSTATIDDIQLGMTTYVLTYDVGDGCAAFYTVNFTGLDCGPPEAALGDTVWFDFNENGLLDPGEPGIEGVTVYLVNANNGSIISTTMTAADGSYLFNALPAGNYAVQFVLPDGFVFTQGNQGGDDTDDSDADPVTGITPPMFVPLDSVDLNFDAGFIPDCSLELDVVVGPCQLSGDTLAQPLMVTARWLNNPYTYDQFGDGNDTLDLSINGVVYTIIASELSDTVLVIDSLINPVATTTFTVDAAFRESTSCTATTNSDPIAPCTYDLALTKTASTLELTPGPYVVGSLVCVDITVFNQGEQPVSNVQVYDSLPAGLTFAAAESALGWSNIAPLQLFTFPGPILPEESAVATLCARITNTGGGVDQYVNRAEINRFTSPSGSNLSAFDEDSQPDNNFSNDAGGEPNGPTDDITNGNPDDPLLPNDEDDSDPFQVAVFDLALSKMLAPAADQPTGRVNSFQIGDEIAFTITLINQGNQTAYAVEVHDSISEGLTLVSASVPATTQNGIPIMETSGLTGGGTSGYLVLDSLSVGDTVNVIVIGLVGDDVVPPIINYAEISAADDDQDPGNDAPTDVDSSPDDNLENDPGGMVNGDSDDATGGDGTGAVGSDSASTDEDDADAAQVPTYDLALIKFLDAESVSPNGNYPPGTEVTFNINVCNQGNEPVTNVTIIDYLPCGLDYLPGNTLNQMQGWTQTSPFAMTPPGQLDSVFLTLTEVLQPDSCRQVKITVARASTMMPDRCPLPLPMNFLTNAAEIRQFEDVDGNVQIDLDSSPDGVQDNDPGGMVNMVTDNQLNGNGTGPIPSDDPLTDEDDADPANLDAFDLAIFKVVDTLDNAPPYIFGEIVKFDIGIISQGNISANEVVISDLIPPGLSFDPSFGNNATAGDGSGWQPTAEGAMLTITDFTGLVNNDLLANSLGFFDTATVSIWLQIEPTAALLDEDYTNLAQIEMGTFINPMTGDPVTVDTDGDSPYGLGAGNDTGAGIGSDDDNETLDDEPGQDVDSQDPAFVMVAALSLGSTVFLDINNDGIQNGLDSGLSAVTVQLFNATTMMQVLTNSMGVPVDNPALASPVVTDSDGNYIFVNLPPGDYYVVIPSTPIGALVSSNNTGIPFLETDPDDDEDGDDDGLQPGGAGQPTTSGVITLSVMMEPTTADGEDAPGSEQDEMLPQVDNNGNMTLDFGFFQPVSVGDTAFVDLNNDGLQTPGEPGLENVTVVLLDVNGDTVTIDAEGNTISGITTTDADGFYEFPNLPLGIYQVLFDISTAVNAENYVFTQANVGNDDEIDSDATPVNDSIGLSNQTNYLTSGMNDPTLDVGVSCNVIVTVADPSTICSTRKIMLNQGASISPSGVGGVWSSPDGTGSFDDGTDFATATTYTPSPEDAARGSVTLVLTTNDPNGPCGTVSAQVTIQILRVDCGSFPWSGDD